MRPFHKYAITKYSPHSPFVDMMSFWACHKKVIKAAFDETHDIDKALVKWWFYLCGTDEAEHDLEPIAVPSRMTDEDFNTLSKLTSAVVHLPEDKWDRLLNTILTTNYHENDLA